MQTMALRPITKINQSVLQNFRRFFSFKFDMTPTRPGAEQIEQAPVQEQAEPETSGKTFRYSVCQQRTTPLEKPTSVAGLMEAQRHNIKMTIEDQHLQPAQLPEYYNKQMDPSVMVPLGADGERQAPKNSTFRRLQESKTYANCTLPFKSVKLANPFPDPVKMMMSRTVSDEEKAQQMLAESKSQQQFNKWSSISGTAPQSRSFSTMARRYLCSTVGTDPEKCKKAKRVKKGTCPRMSLPGCGPVGKNISCQRLAKEVDCKKQEAPYPAYSEFCHEEVEEKPSECKMCPWKTEENPNFKPPKKGMHTSSIFDVRRTGLEVEDGGRKATGEEEVEDGMFCDLRKPPCERPPRRPCGEKPKKLKEEKPKPKPKPEKECMSRISQLLAPNTIVDVQPEEEVVEPMADAMVLRKGPGESTGPCRKFKFPKCGPVKKREPIVRQGKCPPKKKKSQVVDCPPSDEDGTKCSEMATNEFQLAKQDDEDKKKKCPKIDMTIFKEEEEDDDPCKLRRKGTTKICPGDLLKKKRRKPTKKTSGIVSPALKSKTEEQPTATM